MIVAYRSKQEVLTRREIQEFLHGSFVPAMLLLLPEKDYYEFETSWLNLYHI
jgi:hypothetical protein